MSKIVKQLDKEILPLMAFESVAVTSKTMKNSGGI